MKGIKKPLMVSFLFVLISGYSQASWAYSFSGSWLPNSDDVHVQDLSQETGDGLLLLYDPDMDAANWQDDVMGLLLDGVTGGAYTSSTAFFFQSGGSWIASLTPGAKPPQWWGYAILGSDNSFGLAFLYLDGDGKIRDLYTAYDVVKSGEDSYLLTSPEGWEVSLFDADPVPVPAAAYLLGYGIMGLALFVRRSGGKMETES